jgi:L-asparaginase
MRKNLLWMLAAILICGSTLSTFALPKVNVIATGGTIAGTSSGSGYDAGQVSIEDILAAVPELNDYVELDYEQFCNIGSQDMDENSPKPIVLVGSMRPSDSPEADGPKNLVVAVKTAVDPESTGKEVMCCLGEKIFEVGSVFKNDSHAIDANAAVTPDYYMPYDTNTGFDISNVVIK